MESMMIYAPIVLALIGLAYMWVKRSWVLKQDAGDGKMNEIASHIYEGALAFLKAEYKLLSKLLWQCTATGRGKRNIYYRISGNFDRRFWIFIKRSDSHCYGYYNWFNARAKFGGESSYGSVFFFWSSDTWDLS